MSERNISPLECRANEPTDLTELIQQLNEANKNHAIAYGALTIALLQKGVISEQEYDQAVAQATHVVDQEFALKRDQKGCQP